MPNRMGLDDGYVAALGDRLILLQTDLTSLAQIADERDLTRFEFIVVERDFQILIEACIGLAKRLVKLNTGQTPTDALAAFKALQGAGLFSGGLDWRPIIGMRNVIVHDYLDVDQNIVLEVLKSGEFWTLFEFCRHYL